MQFIGKTIPPMSSQNFQRILKFYLLECPVRLNGGNNVVQRVRNFANRGFVGQKLTLLLNAMRKVSIGFRDRFVTAPETVEDVYSEIMAKNCPYREFSIVKATNTTQTESIYYCIRNAMAHGSFSTEEHNGQTFYHFESRSPRDRNKLRGRVCVSEETLLAWIDIIEKGTIAYTTGRAKAYKELKAELDMPDKNFIKCPNKHPSFSNVR